jgi:hypothetical protein
MPRAVDFVDGEALVMLLPIDAPNGERLELERWSFDQVVEELEYVAEAAARGDKWANRVYQRLVYSLRSGRAERLAMGDSE